MDKEKERSKALQVPTEPPVPKHPLEDDIGDPPSPPPSGFEVPVRLGREE